MTTKATETPSSCLFPVDHLLIASERTPTVESASEIVNRLFQLASQESNLGVKRRVFEEAFSALRASYVPQLRPWLFRLLEAYAKQTWYAQESEVLDAKGQSVDSELGFRICARLMELSFCMQMDDLNLNSCPYDWFSHTSLESLFHELQTEPGQKGLLFNAVDQITVDVGVLVAKAHEKGLREIMAQTLRSLTYSYQNIEALCDASSFKMHRKLQDWTEALIGKETIEQRQQLAEYLYNRCKFMIGMHHGSWAEMVAGYEEMKRVFSDCYPQGDPILLKKNAQISNIEGCIISRSGEPNALRMAEPYFLRAYDGYSSVPRDKFLIGNVLSGLIACLTNGPLAEERASKLQKYSKELQAIISEFQEEGNLHCYVTEYPQSVQKAEEALARYRS